MNNELLFEWEYLKGKKWNGKEYDKNNNILYEWKEGNGYIKEYYRNGGLILKGEYLNGQLRKKNFDINDNLLFKCEHLFGFKRKGKTSVDGILEYEGEFLFHRKWNGKGYDKNGNVIYILNNGNVREYFFNNLAFEGEYINDKRTGKVYKIIKIYYLNSKKIMEI